MWVTTLHSCYQLNGHPQIALPCENMQLSEIYKVPRKKRRAGWRYTGMETQRLHVRKTKIKQSCLITGHDLSSAQFSICPWAESQDTEQHKDSSQYHFRVSGPINKFFYVKKRQSKLKLTVTRRHYKDFAFFHSW